jgi:3-dehydroquinate synthase
MTATQRRRCVEVSLGARSYPIHIGDGLLDDHALLSTALRGRHVLVVTDDQVAPRYLDRVLHAIPPEKSVETFVVPHGETHKTLEFAQHVFERLATMRASRDATIVALGGGVIGDLAGFAAACWMRGIAFVQVPTTLLAMVDSSVGGKTAVNLPQGKNLVGAFHQPRAVVADTATLSTLPPREFRAGLAEVVKYGAIRDALFFDWLEQRADRLLAREPEILVEAIASSCRHKAEIVMSDEREEGERALLNFGHTFGHALETAGHYERFVHGEAVAIGMVCAARLSAQLGMAGDAATERLVALLRGLGLPTEIPADFAPRELLALMHLDKKAASGRLKLILWRGIGEAEIVESVDEDAVLGALGG